MQYDLAVIGNDEAAFEMLCLAAESGKRTAAVLPRIAAERRLWPPCCGPMAARRPAMAEPRAKYGAPPAATRPIVFYSALMAALCVKLVSGSGASRRKLAESFAKLQQNCY